MGVKYTRTLVTGFLMVLVVTAVACSSSGSGTGERPETTIPAGDPVRGGELVVGLVGDAAGYDPGSNQWTPAATMVARAIYDPLAVYDENGVPQPYLAEAFEPNETFTSWTIRLRQGVEFHNGQPVDADALVANLENVRRGTLTAQAAVNIVGVSKVDDLSVQVDFEQPNAHFPATLTGQAGYVVAPEQLDSDDPDVLIGSGPFVFDSWERDAELSVTRNPNYWQEGADGESLPYLAAVTFRMMPDAATRAQALETSDLDLIQTVDASTIIDFENGDLRDVSGVTEASDKWFLSLNTVQGPFADPDLRRAAAMAIDREELIRTLLDPAIYEVAEGPMLPGSPWGNPDNWPELDPDAARALVEAAEADGADTSLSLTVIAGNAEVLATAQFIEQSLDAIGFDVTIDARELTAFAIAVGTGTTDLFLFPFWDELDPDPLWTFLHSATALPPGELGLNFARWADDEVSNALDAARASEGDEARRAQYDIVWERMGEEVPYVFLYVNIWALLWREGVFNVAEVPIPDGGVSPAVSRGSTFLARVWVEG